MVPDLMRFRELRFLDRFDLLVPIVMAFSLFGLGKFLSLYFPGSGTSGWQMLIWGFFVSTILLFHGSCSINSLAHLMGSKRYDTGDESRNSFLLSLVTLGEGWHNNHHHYPATVRQGFFWWEVDITFYLLKVMSWLGLIWDLRPVPEQVRAARLPQPGDV
jgi:stearoyl-CoA desaturase (delta-9 desaturase)